MNAYQLKKDIFKFIENIDSFDFEINNRLYRGLTFQFFFAELSEKDEMIIKILLDLASRQLNSISIEE